MALRLIGLISLDTSSKQYPKREKAMRNTGSEHQEILNQLQLLMRRIDQLEEKIDSISLGVPEDQVTS